MGLSAERRRQAAVCQFVLQRARPATVTDLTVRKVRERAFETAPNIAPRHCPDTILIDLGAVHGLRTGMPVVTVQGLVGRISSVTENNAKVLLLSDPSSLASALLADSRLNGIVRGDTGNHLVMDFLPQGPTFAVGEAVLSSGLGGQFPRGLRIGTIDTIESQPNAVFQTATVRPAVDFSSLELVMVITNFAPSQGLNDLLNQAEETAPVQSAPAQSAPAQEETAP